ncbi:OLC1v1012255C1 [Oldenlandia corymbosa var. corymbosa]|uniref:OLC1v1012255C1 n=1 Tax=Oldenlandia corymbosa var. corymbosa TaxID=529605 RepID=A0AAV1DVM9_OLDCO|nr:OLC1v1012255C1 [Oldenlandia corymbosa var. corymbosa]
MDIVSGVLAQISTLIVGEANLLGGVGQEIQRMVDELGHMQAFLRFAESKEEEDPRLEEWIVQVQDVAYDIQDVLDEFMLRFRHHHGQGFYGHVRKIFSSMKNLREHHRIACVIQGIKSRITSISESYKRYQFEYGASSNQVLSASSSVVTNNNSWRDYRDDTPLLVEEAKLVGIDGPKQQLISQLLDGDPELKVVSVLGMGGIGKTTLIKKVHGDGNVLRHFQVLAWVTISQTYDMKELLKELIQQLYISVGKYSHREEAKTEQLKALVKDFLQNKRYAIVFDDVWDSNFWEAIKFALPEGCHGNRVILTTRIADVARASGAEFNSYVHQMRPLSSDDSWTLFCKRTFKDNCCPVHLKDVALRILRKCIGLPLAIVVISGVLASKDNGKIDEWNMVECSLGGELEFSGKLSAVRKILLLSYNELPYHLKTCLLYASIFPEDYKIKESNFIRCLVAEGFVVQKSRMTKYEVARAYLDELANMSLIQVSDGSPGTDFFRVYQIHDLLREILLSKAMRQNFATIVASGEHPIRLPRKVRRLAFHDFKSDAKGSSISFKHLRSLIFINSLEPLSKSQLSRMLHGGFRPLKVLDLVSTGLKEIPKEVFTLFYLTSLNLKHTKVKIIPRSIGALKNLEFLDLSYTNVSEVPEDILKIKGLIHLIVYRCSVSSGFTVKGFKGPNNISKFSSLEQLLCIEANETVIKEIEKLKKLKILAVTIIKREDQKHFFFSLGKLTNLRELFLQTATSDEVIDLDDINSSFCSGLQNLQNLCLIGRLKRLPHLMSCLKGLLAVKLVSSRLKSEPLESLQHLPNLRGILFDQAYEGAVLNFKSGCFLKLDSLILVKLHSLEYLRIEEGAMPNLGTLAIISLQSLQEFPWGVQHLAKVQQLYLELMSDKVTVELQNHHEDSENYKKISHILQILIWDREDGWCRHPQYWKTRKPGMSFTGLPAHVEGINNHQEPVGYYSVATPSEVAYIR